jgi:DNA-binding NtrC family response regulator
VALPTTRLTAPYGRQVILLIEDDHAICALVRSFLEEQAHDVLVAANGNEAVEVSRTHRGTIDLLLTNISMQPFMDGITAYRKISSERPNIKVLFMSAGGSQVRLPEPWPFVSKPFGLDVLRKKINDVLTVHAPVKGNNTVVILVVDPQSARRERTTDILNEQGYAVLTANSAEEAKPIAESIARIDLIISEVVFSAGDSGVHFAEQVKASERHISTLLISHFTPDILHDVHGFSKQPEFLPNPFTREALLGHVHRLLALRDGRPHEIT